MAGNPLTIAPSSGSTGTFVVIASVSDGISVAGRAFKVTVA